MPCCEQPAWSYQWSTVCGCLCWTRLHLGKTRLLSKAGFQEHWARVWTCIPPKAPWILPHLPGFRLSHWERLWQSGEDGTNGSPMRERCCSGFRKGGGYHPHPRATESVLDFALSLPGRSPSIQMCGASGANGLGLPEARRVFLWDFPWWVSHQSGSWKSGENNPSLQPLTNPHSPTPICPDSNSCPSLWLCY